MAVELVPTNELGIALPPAAPDCKGDDCHRQDMPDGCYVSRHHGCFPEFVYKKSELHRAYRDHPFNIHRMARCAHDDEHDRYGISVPPRRQIMRAFLDEASLLEHLGVVTENIAVLGDALDEWDEEVEFSRRRYDRWARAQLHRDRFMGHLFRYLETGFQLEEAVGSLEVVPRTLVVATLGRFRAETERIETIAA